MPRDSGGGWVIPVPVASMTRGGQGDSAVPLYLRVFSRLGLLGECDDVLGRFSLDVRHVICAQSLHRQQCPNDLWGSL